MCKQVAIQHLTFRFLFGCSLLAAAIGVRAAEAKYSRDVTRWQEISVPPKGENAERVVWDYAANYSEILWRVSLENSRPTAELIERRTYNAADLAPFDPRADGFRGARRFKEVDDGWLVAFNHGEFGAALYWFNQDGKRHYKISHHHVVAFLSLPNDIYAIEGLAHMASCGSLIRITRPTISAHWQASLVVRLPFAPSTAVVRRDGSILIALSDSLVSVGPDHHITTLIPDAPWAGAGLSPSSSILLSDESRLYLGMVQFVGEVDLATNHLRLLVPSVSFQNQLPDEQERRIRAQYAKGMGVWHQPDDICEQLEEARIRNGR
jgi:hypothetical protein